MNPLAAPVIRSFAGQAMASPLRLTAVQTRADDPSGCAGRAERAWRDVVDEFAACEVAMSRFLDTSEVTTLNRAALQGSAMAVSRRLGRALSAADRAHRLTRGRFDPRIVGLLDAWGYRGAPLTVAAPADTAPADQVAAPADQVAASADHLAAPERILERGDRDRVRLPHPVDLGGIGKGLALRFAAERVRSAGIDRFLLDAGGDLVTTGTSPDGGPWRVGIEDPCGGDTLVAVIEVIDAAAATSSIRRHRWIQDGDRRHHLVDPATAQPADGGLLAVTVVAADPAWAEVWTKSLFIAGHGAIGAEARARGLAAWWVTIDGVLEMTPAARAATVWVATEVDDPV